MQARVGVVGPEPGHLLHGLLGGIDVAPGPVIHLIEPDPVIAPFPPGAFRQGNDRPGSAGLKDFAPGAQAHLGVVLEPFEHLIEPLGTLEPPVADEFGIIGRHHHAGPALFGFELRQDPRHQRDKVVRLVIDPGRHPLGMVGLLISQIGLGAGHLPVAQAAGETLLVKIQKIAIAGIPPLAAPHLEAGLGVTGEDGHRAHGLRGRTHQVDLVGGLILLLRPLLVLGGKTFPQTFQGIEPVFIDPDGLPPLQEVGVDEKILEAVFRQELFHPLAQHRFSGQVFHRRSPGIARPVGAFRKPKPLRVPAEMTAVGSHPLLHLGLDRGVPAQQRQIAVGSGGGNDFQNPGIHQALKGPNQVLAKILAEGPPQFPVVVCPHPGQ